MRYNSCGCATASASRLLFLATSHTASHPRAIDRLHRRNTYWSNLKCAWPAPDILREDPATSYRQARLKVSRCTSISGHGRTHMETWIALDATTRQLCAFHMLRCDRRFCRAFTHRLACITQQSVLLEARRLGVSRRRLCWATRL